MPNIAVKKPYHVDLAELMRVYETNYAKLNALLPVGHEVGDVRCYQAVNMVYQLTVNEVTKYTTLIDICQSDGASVSFAKNVCQAISRRSSCRSVR